MARPTNKDSLLGENQKSFNQILELIASIPDGEKDIPGVNGNWSV